jgi:hypothetical protein
MVDLDLLIPRNREENKMVIKEVLKYGAAAAIGAVLTYAAIDRNVIEQVGTPTTTQCESVYSAQVQAINAKFADIAATPGVATLDDISIDYVVSPESGFKGLIFEDKASGQYGVITKSEFLGKNSFNMNYTNLEAVLQKVETVPATNGVSVYSSEKETVTQKK